MIQKQKKEIETLTFPTERERESERESERVRENESESEREREREGGLCEKSEEEGRIVSDRGERLGRDRRRLGRVSRLGVTRRDSEETRTWDW